MSGVTQDSTSFRSYRKGSMSARRMSGDRSDGSESAKSFRSEDLLISKKLSIDEQDVSSGGLDFSQSNKSLHNSSGHSLHIPSEDGELAGASNMLFTINEEDRTRSNLSLGRDSSVMTLDPGMLTARSERSHLPLMVQTDLADEESGNRFEGNEGWEQVANSESQVLKKWKQSMNVVSAAQGFLTSGTLRRSRLDLIDEGHESHEGAQSDSNITQHIEHHEQIAAAVTAVTAVTHKPLASPSNFDHRPAPKLASLVQRIKEQNEGSDSVSKSKSKLLKKVGGSIITSMRVSQSTVSAKVYYLY